MRLHEKENVIYHVIKFIGMWLANSDRLPL